MFGVFISPSPPRKMRVCAGVPVDHYIITGNADDGPPQFGLHRREPCGQQPENCHRSLFTPPAEQRVGCKLPSGKGVVRREAGRC